MCIGVENQLTVAQEQVEVLGLIRVEEIMPLGREYGVVEEEA